MAVNVASASGEPASTAARCGSSPPVCSRQSSTNADARREAALYFSRAAPVFSATTPLTPIANVWPGGTATARSKRTGQ